MTFLLQTFRHDTDTDGRTKGIRITDGMAHDEHILMRFDHFPQGMRLDTRLHAGILRDLPLTASVIGKILSLADHRLVSAAGQGQIDGGMGKFVILGIAVSGRADTDGQSNRPLLADLDGLDILDQVEAFFL